MTAPQRIHRRRLKGWRKPPGAVCVTRPSIFGNPFTVAAAREAGCRGTDAELARWCVDLFRRWVATGKEWDGPAAEAARAKLLAGLPALRGKDLCCFCPPGSPCHADVLIEVANR